MCIIIKYRSLKTQCQLIRTDTNRIVDILPGESQSVMRSACGNNITGLLTFIT